MLALYRSDRRADALLPRPGVGALAFSPNGRVLAAGTDDGSVLFWNAASRVRAGPPLATHQGRIRSIGFGRDGTTVVTAPWDGPDTTMWDVAHHRRLQRVGPGGPMAVSPDAGC